MTEDRVNQLENQLNGFDLDSRRESLKLLVRELETGKLDGKPEGKDLNLHCHTFFSYNGYGYSPAYIAWLGKKEGWFASGIVDFDVLDGVNEYISACTQLDTRGVTGMETRVFIPELAADEINSPGEPGISYHMGVGFVSSDVPNEAKPFLDSLKQRAADRTRSIVELVNAHLSPIELDFEKDVIPLTPSGNATERHVCAAYEKKARGYFRDPAQLGSFWSEKLDIDQIELEKILDDSVKMQALIRSKTMKSGGVGYRTPKPENFPEIGDMNGFIRQCGGIPVLTWLNGLSSGEKDVNRLMDLHASYGSVAINIIPDRNWNIKNTHEREKKVTELHRIVAAAKERDLPIIIGTEMNAPGLKLVDAFESEALSPYVDDFVDGAAIVFAHMLLAPEGKGYLSEWSMNEFSTLGEKNAFFAKVGRLSRPGKLQYPA